MITLQDWMKAHRGSEQIKLFTGNRGMQKNEHVLSELGEKTLSIDFEDPKFRHLRKDDDVIAYLKHFRTRGVKKVLLCEPGRIVGHTSLLKKLYDPKAWNIYVTASSRHIIDDIRKHYSDCPVAVYRVMKPFEEKRSTPTLKMLWYQSYIYDVADCLEAACMRRFQALFEYYSMHIGEVISNRRTAKELPIHCNRGCATLIGDYRKTLEDAYLVEFVECYDVFEGKVVKNNPKVFVTDLEMRNYLSGEDSAEDRHRQQLNRLYLELRCNYRKVYWPRDEKGYDFMTLSANGEKRFWKL